MKSEAPEGLTPEAREEYARFLAAYEENQKRSDSIALSILIWGPDPARDTPVANKRREIRDQLREKGHNAMFSEDIPEGKSKLSEKSKEFAQALAAHLIIILVEDSQGALAEAHDFCNHPDIAPKVMALVPKRYKKGYSARGAMRDLEHSHGGVFWYADEDLTRCKVCSMAIRRAEALRQLRFRGGVLS
jgi:hypothetical protein